MRSSGKRATPEPKSPDRPTRSFRSLPSLYASYFFAVFFRLSDCARRRSSRSLASGVNSAPKSSASNTWRISISDSPAWGLGQRLTHSIASSLDFTCQIQKPATSSFVSAKGPSTTVRFAPENLTRAPFELGWSPSPASITPAFTSSSLNFPIAARSFSSGITPASESLLALTMIMNRIVFSVGLGAGSPDGFRSDENLALTVRRTRLREIDRLNELLLIVDRLVGRGPEIAIDRRSDRRFPDALGHEDAGHVLPGVGVRGRAVAAVPAVGPDGARPCFVSWATRSARRARVSLQPWFWPRPASPGGVVCRTVSFVLPPSSANVTVVTSSWPGSWSRIAVKTMRSLRTISR